MIQMLWAAPTNPTMRKMMRRRARRGPGSGLRRRVRWVQSRTAALLTSCCGKSALASGQSSWPSSVTLDYRYGKQGSCPGDFKIINAVFSFSIIQCISETVQCSFFFSTVLQKPQRLHTTIWPAPESLSGHLCPKRWTSQEAWASLLTSRGWSSRPGCSEQGASWEMAQGSLAKLLPPSTDKTQTDDFSNIRVS